MSELLCPWTDAYRFFSNLIQHMNRRNTISINTKDSSKSLEGKRTESCQVCVGSVCATSISSKGAGARRSAALLVGRMEE